MFSEDENSQALLVGSFPNYDAFTMVTVLLVAALLFLLLEGKIIRSGKNGAGQVRRSGARSKRVSDEVAKEEEQSWRSLERGGSKTRTSLSRGTNIRGLKF